MVFGYGRWAQVRKEANLMERSLADVATVGRALVATMLILESRNMGDVSCLICHPACDCNGFGVG